MIRIPCSKCGTTEFPKYRRMKLRKTGKRTESMASYCIVCHKENQKIIEARRYEKKLEYNRIYRMLNKTRINKYKRKSYNKIKKLTYIPNQEIGNASLSNYKQGLAALTYT